MGRVKEFAVWLSSCVYQWEMTEEEIISKFKQKEGVKEMDDIEPWLKSQIKYVRSNPEEFQELMSWRRGQDY